MSHRADRQHSASRRGSDFDQLQVRPSRVCRCRRHQVLRSQAEQGRVRADVGRADPGTVRRQQGIGYRVFTARLGTSSLLQGVQATSLIRNLILLRLMQWIDSSPKTISAEPAFHVINSVVCQHLAVNLLDIWADPERLSDTFRSLLLHQPSEDSASSSPDHGERYSFFIA